MRLLKSTLLLAAVGLSLAACGGDDETTRPTTPVNVAFRTNVFADIPGTARDTVKGIIIVDGTDTLDLPYDTIAQLPRGNHTFEAHLTHDYLPSVFTANIDPSGNRTVVNAFQAGTCRVWTIDADFCAPRNVTRRNALFWSQRTRIFCPAGDFGDFCNELPDARSVGLSWPTDSVASALNEYVTHSRLLIAATVGTGLPAAGTNIATALYRIGDYAPRRRLRAVEGDSARYSNIVWTDARHIPIYDFTRGVLDDADRKTALFGLEVKQTYYLPTAYQDVVFVRFDVKNISADPDYQRVHPEVPVDGFTTENIYLAPVVDADIGGGTTSEAPDDAATVFPSDNLVAAYDRDFAVGYWTGRWKTGPGLVGVKLLGTDAGTARALVLGTYDTLSYLTPTLEADAWRAISAGRNGARTGCTEQNGGTAYICTGENKEDVRIGWSVGPIAALAPGQSRQVTIAILLAEPKAGTFTSGTGVAPVNTDLASTTRPIYGISEALRALAGQIASVTVTPAP